MKFIDMELKILKSWLFFQTIFLWTFKQQLVHEIQCLFVAEFTLPIRSVRYNYILYINLILHVVLANYHLIN